MGVLQNRAVSFGAILLSVAIGLVIPSVVEAKCFGQNAKDVRKYGCQENENQSNFSFSTLFGSSEESQEPNKLSSESFDRSSNYDSNSSFSGSFESDYSFPPLKGPKRTIAVLDFENKVNGVYGATEIGLGVTEILITELHKSDHFIVVERSALADILKEQELGLTGLVRKEGTPRAGGFAGTQLLIKGVITEFDYKAGGGGLGLNFAGINLGNKSKNAHVGLDIRLIDPNTAEILDAHSVAVKAASSGWNVGYSPKGQDLTVGSGFFEETPLGQATRQAVGQAVAYIVQKSQAIPWTGSVIKADGGKIFINRGANSNVKVGDQMTIFSKGEVLIDPDTGLNLGTDEEPVGTLTLIEVLKKFSVGRYELFDPSQTIQRGDRVRYSSQASVRDPDANF